MSSTVMVGHAEPARSVRLAQRLHDTVAQRLAGIACLLAADGPLPDEAVDRCRCEVEAALGELRDVLTSVASAAPDTSSTIDMRTELEALLTAFPAVDLRWMSPDAVELAPGGLIEKFLAEALRNIRKHACPTQVAIYVIHDHGATVIDVVNDGVAPRKASSCGVGRRLLEVEAALHGALVEFKQQRPGRWLQRLILPATAPELGEAQAPKETLFVAPREDGLRDTPSHPRRPGIEQASRRSETVG